MDSKVSQYQRAVTPTIENSSNSSSVGLRGKILSYSSNTNGIRARTGPTTSTDRPSFSVNGSFRSATNSSGLNDITVQGRATASANMSAGGVKGTTQNADSATAVTYLPRFDLIPIYDEIPADGIIFARIRNQTDSLVIYRTQEERLRNPERLNLDRRQLEICPQLEQEHRLRLLNYQNNRIRQISNLENLPNLIFLDLYNNQITSLDGPLQTAKGLRVLMAGKNKINEIKNLSGLKKLDVLDLHSNEIKSIEGLDGLTELRVLNLAGNRISIVNNLHSLTSLTELNLRRNYIQHISGLNKLPSLQRVFLSHNSIQNFQEVQCIFEIQYLIELSMDGNPLAEQDAAFYRMTLIASINTLKHLDLKRITDEERLNLLQLQQSSINQSTNSNNHTFSSTSMKSIKDIWNSGKPSAINSTATHLDIQGEFQLPLPVETLNDGDADGENVFHEEFGGNDWEGFRGKETTRISVNDPSLSIETNNMEESSVVGSNLQPSEASANSLGLLSLIKSGRLPRNYTSVLDLEILNSEEKVLLGIGDTWDWTAVPRRLLPTVTDMYFVYMKREALSAKLSSNLLQPTVMLALRRLCIIGCELTTLKQVDLIVQYLQSNPNVKHLLIEDCQISSSLLRSYVIANNILIQSFNGIVITSEERLISESSFTPWLNLRKKSLKQFTSCKLGSNNFLPQTVGTNDNSNIINHPKNTLSLVDVVKNTFESDVDAYIPSTGNGSRDLMKRVPSAQPNKKTGGVSSTGMSQSYHDNLSKEFDVVMKDLVINTLEDIVLSTKIYLQ